MEICKTIKKKAREDIRKHNLDEIRETLEASKSLKKVRRTQPRKNQMITLLDKPGKEIQEQDRTMEPIEEFYSELYHSDEAVTIQTYPEQVPPIMAWEVEAALRKMKNGKEAGKDQVNIETLKAGGETIAKQLAKLYTKVLDIMYTVRKMKWSWAGHINRLKDNRWTSRVTTWRPYDKKMPSGGETTWSNTGATRYGRGQHNTW